MLEALLAVIERLIKLVEGRVKGRKEVFHDLLDPTFTDLLLIHGDYIKMFESLQVFGGSVPGDELELQRRLDIAKADLRARRRDFEPVRRKVQALVQALGEHQLPDEERKFVEAVIRYLPSADPAVPHSAATTLLEYLETVLPEELDLLIDATLQRHRNAWSQVCTDYANLKIKIAELR